MTEQYIAILRKDPDSDWSVEFPDVAGCFSAGKTPAEALDMAHQALQAHLDTSFEHGLPVPRPSSNQVVATPSHPQEQVILSLIRATPPVKRVRINITIQDRLLQTLDESARKDGLTRSGKITQLIHDHI